MDNRLIHRLRNLAHNYWQEACKYDGINEDVNLIVFSPDNPYAQAYDIALEALFEARYGKLLPECA